MELALNQITVAGRFRKEMGDLGALVASIADLGLLHPILVTPDSRLIDGERRIRAYAQLGYATIEARVVHVPSLLRAEHDANELAKTFTVSERVAIARAIEDEIHAQGERRGRPRQDAEHTPAMGHTDEERIVANWPQLDPGQKTRQIPRPEGRSL